MASLGCCWPGSSEFDYHRKWKSVPHFQTADLARINLAHVLKELDHLTLELELVWWRPRRCWVLQCELHAAYSRGPWIENQLTVINPKALKAAKTELLHRDDEGALAGQ